MLSIEGPMSHFFKFIETTTFKTCLLFVWDHYVVEGMFCMQLRAMVAVAGLLVLVQRYFSSRHRVFNASLN